MTTIARATWTDDDGSGTTGTIINNQRLQQDVYDKVDGALAALDGKDASQDSSISANTSALAAKVSGPASSTDNTVPRFDGATGKLLQASALTLSDAGEAVILGAVPAGVRVSDPAQTGDARLCRGSQPQFSGNVAQDAAGNFNLDDVAKLGGALMIVPADGSLQYYNFTAGANPRTARWLMTVGDVALGLTGGIRERNRTTLMGEWINIPYSAGIFTASGSMTWTVPGAPATLAYMMVGRTCFLFFNIGPSTIGGTLSTDLFVTLPFNPTISTPSVVRHASGSTFTSALAYFVVGQSKLGIEPLAGGNFVAQAGNYYVQGMAVCQV